MNRMAIQSREVSLAELYGTLLVCVEISEEEIIRQKDGLFWTDVTINFSLELVRFLT